MKTTAHMLRVWLSLLSLFFTFSKDESMNSVAEAVSPAGSFHLKQAASLSTSRRSQRHVFQRRRSLIMFGTMDDWIQHQKDPKHVRLASSTSAIVEYKPPPLEDDYHPLEESEGQGQRLEENNEAENELRFQSHLAPEADAAATKRQGKMWPPWPFNLLQRSTTGAGPFRQGPVVRAGTFIFSFFGQRARVSFKELQDVGSRLWFHLPPMTPPLILLTLLPRQEPHVVISAETGLEVVIQRTVIPLWSNPLARTLVVGGFSFAILSWAHSELNRLRKLTPLPLNYAYRDIHSAVLPHALPEEVPEPFLVEEDDDDEEDESSQVGNNDRQDSTAAASESTAINIEGNDSPDTTTAGIQSSSSISQKLLASVPPRLQRHFKQFGGAHSKGGGTDNNGNDEGKPQRRFLGSNWRKNMKHMRDARRAESLKVRRMQIYDELVALQAIKRIAKPKLPRKQAKAKPEGGNGREEPLGYALITGASRGIGRAIAVELARWEIPLILVARDLSRLTSLAYDLEACYGVKCCVIQADLAEPHAAEQIHQATREAGLTVDILVNNAGISSTGLAVDMSLQEVDRMMRVNGLAVAHLAHLYGKDMKERRRGRILMVTSVVGAVAAGPTVAMYAATKSFEKTLGLSLAKELEPYGVGVTCLMPGAVKDTDFRSGSNTHEALCWKLPGYAKTASSVASTGVRALLVGDVEVTPGWQNRAFLKVLQPAMPQRLHTILVEIAWNPPYVPPFLKFWKSADNRQNERQKLLEQRNKHDVEETRGDRRLKTSPQEWRPRFNAYLPPPLILRVPGEVDIASKAAPVPLQAEAEVDHSSLVGPEPTTDAQQASPTPRPPTEAITSVESDQLTEGNSHNDPYTKLRELPIEFDTTISNNSTVHDGSDPSSESIGEGTETSDRQPQQRPHQGNPSELRDVLELQQQVLKLQQEVLAKERQQFLGQMELERRQRELEYDRHDIERERAQKDGNQESRNMTGWQRRDAKQSNVERERKEPSAPSKPILMQPQSAGRRDLMSESLEHPLLAP